MRFNSHSNSDTPPSEPDETLTTPDKNSPVSLKPDFTSPLSDQILISILSNLTKSQQISSCLVCKRWLRISGGLVKSLRLLDWDFLDSGRLAHRFPNLLDVDIVQACIVSPRNSEVFRYLLKAALIYEGLSCLVQPTKGFRNLQILKLIGSVDGLYDSVISDIGLTILAQVCPRLLKLELVGCEGSYDGIKAIGQCCQMMEELTLSDHRLEGCCPTLEELHLQRCQLRDKQGLGALFLVCEAVRELVFEDCWGLDNNTFFTASICRRVMSLSLEGCSLLTMEGFDPVVVSWKELKRLKVVSCNNIKDSAMSPELATLFSLLKELKWRPDSKSILSSGLNGTGIWQKGGRSFKI
ncbi:unnamed protein product [Lactuca saligna]|uniref:F-box domain-containing protein n=1 Tax=Lactuca saligna TaxID=75948 RepID=A0AA35ZGS4_LACSI|nr:unnamed protein product [Lactuca saligna]